MISFIIGFIVGVVVGAIAVVLSFAYTIVRSERKQEKRP